MPPRTKTVPQRVTRRKEVLPKNLDLLPSVSRSGGTAAEGDGDSYVVVDNPTQEPTK